MKPRLELRGFTLIELLVVIGIIALLIALLLPTLERAREVGFRIKCLSGIKQAGMAVRQYANDNKEYIPSHNYQYMAAAVGGPAYSALLVDAPFAGLPSDPAPIMNGAGYTQTDNFTNRGGCPYGPATYSDGGDGGEYYSDPISPVTSYGIPGEIQTGYSGGPGDYGPFRFSERRLLAFSNECAILTCCHIPGVGGALRRLGASPVSGQNWISEAVAGNPQEASAYPILWKTLGLQTAVAYWTPNPPEGKRHKGEGLPMTFADIHAEFVSAAEITSKTRLADFTAATNFTVWWNPINAKSYNGTSTFGKTQYRRMMITYGWKYFYPEIDGVAP